MTTVDQDALRDRISALVSAWRPDRRVAGLRPLVGGKSSLTYLVTLAGEGEREGERERQREGEREARVAPVVVKMAPPGLPPVRNRDVLRQARVQDAIAGTGRAPVAAIRFTDPGDPPDVPPLYAMEFVEGESFEPLLDERAVLPPAREIHHRMVAAARTLAGLHSIEPQAVGLDDEPEVTLVDEVLRWVRIFETVTDDLRPGYRACADSLLDALPAPLPSTIVHGEYRLGNMLARGDDVVAVIDWELWTREDPRIDLSWFLSYLDADEQPSAIRPTPPGMPTRAELLAVYEEASGAAVPDLSWFDAHARFKMAAIASLVNKHNRRLDHPDPAQEALVPVIGPLIEQAGALLDT